MCMIAPSDLIGFSSNLQVTRTGMKSRMSSNSGHIEGGRGLDNSLGPDWIIRLGVTPLCIKYLTEQSDLGLHCLPRSICPKAKGHYSLVLFQPEPSHRKTCVATDHEIISMIISPYR